MIKYKITKLDNDKELFFDIGDEFGLTLCFYNINKNIQINLYYQYAINLKLNKLLYKMPLCDKVEL